MTRRTWTHLGLVLLALSAGWSCASTPNSVALTVPPPPPQPAAVPQPPPPPDPTESVIAESNRLFERGESEYQLGHLDRAREEFDKALDLLMSVPGGARQDSRVREQFDTLVSRISAYEVTALARADGFTETTSDPAPVDELLANSVFDAAGPAPEVATQVEATVAATHYDLPIEPTDAVMKYVELYSGKLRDWFAASLQRGTQYLPMIQNTLRAEGLPLDLAYVPIVESAFKPSALSRARAKGVWQFVRDTARMHDLRYDWYVDERSDPEKATQAAAQYFKTLNTLFDGDWLLAIASYNGGPGRIQRAIKKAGTDDFWELARRRKLLPRETREYVPAVLAAIIVARSPEQYGITVTPDPPMAYESVLVPKPMDLRRVAEWAGTSIDSVQALNPELRRWTTPAYEAGYEVKVPVGTADALRERLATATPADFASFQFHVVRRGETLSSVAKRFGVKRADLADANDISTRARVRPGQELLIPRAPAVALAARTPASGQPTETVATTSASKVTHRVRRGETLSSIARLYSTTVAAIKRWNGLHSSRITAGDRLTIFRTQETATAVQ